MNKKRAVFFIAFLGFLYLTKTSVQAAKINPDKISLMKPLPLSLRYKVGETLYYKLDRLNLSYRTDGSKWGEMKSLAYFTRTRLPNDEQGRVQEKFTWQSFQWGQSMSILPAKMSPFKEAENFSLVLSVQDENAIHKLDFSQLPRTMEGIMFMIMVWDAITFDGPVRATENFLFPESAPIGTNIENKRQPHDFNFEYPPIMTNSKYTFSGKEQVKILGVSLVKNIPCAIVEFSQAENKVQMNVHLKPVELTSKGFEHFWGKTYISLQDGKVVHGELAGPIILIQDTQMADQTNPTRFELFTMGYLTLDWLTPEEFGRQIKDLKKK